MPAVATESVFVTSTIDPFEGRKLATMDLPSDFLHTPMDSKYPKVYVVLQVKLSEIMVKVDLKLNKKFVSTNSKGLVILYEDIQKSL